MAKKNYVDYEHSARGKQQSQRLEQNEAQREKRLARYRRNAEDSVMLNANANVATSAFKFIIIIPLVFMLFQVLISENGTYAPIHFETFLDMLTSMPTLDISWIPKISGWTSGMSELAQKIFGFILKPVEFSMYIVTGLAQLLTIIGYAIGYMFAF